MLESIEAAAGWAGGLAAVITLAAIYLGIARGMHRPPGRAVGRTTRLLHMPLFHLLLSLLFFWLCRLIWRPLPLALSAPGRWAALLAGALLYFSGLGLTLWGRLALGRQYFVSTSMGAQLFAGHRLVTHGPFALVRHPMYLGILLTGLGGLLLYRTWTMVFITLMGIGLRARAAREEQVLAAEFGEAWLAYCRRTPFYFPRLHSRRLHSRRILSRRILSRRIHSRRIPHPPTS